MYKNYANRKGRQSLLSAARMFVYSMANPFLDLKPLIMRVKLICIFLSVAFLQISFAAKAQYITLSKNNISLTELFKEIKRQSGYDFVYKHDLLSKGKRISIAVQNKPLREVLDQSFKDQPFNYTIESKTVVVFPKPQPPSTQISQPVTNIKGRVVDSNNVPLEGVSISNKQGNVLGVTNASGEYTVRVDDRNSTLVFSAVGYQSLDIALNNRTTVNIVLQESVEALNEVVVTRSEEHTSELQSRENLVCRL